MPTRAPAAKAGGKREGAADLRPYAEQGRAASAKARAERADAHAQDVAHTIEELRAAGFKSMYALAKGLNARDVPTPRGVGKWRAAQVARVLERVHGAG